MENLTFAPMSSRVTAELAKLSSASHNIAASSQKASLHARVINALFKRHVITNPWGHSE